jgi:transcription antitermination protein NusB
MAAEFIRQKQRRDEDKATERSVSRLAAVQALYQMEVAHVPVAEVVAEFTKHRFEESLDDKEMAKADTLFFGELLHGVVRRQLEIDPLLDQQLAAGWRLKRIDSILRACLRAATFELLERHEVPARVVINEYIEVGHAFFDGEEPKVVNGVLDKLAKKLRPAEFDGEAKG